MRKILLKSQLALICLLCSVSMYAYDFKVDGIYYNRNTADNTATVVSQSLADKDYTGNGVVVIPDVIEYEGVKYTVTGIVSGIFKRCTKLTSITIPGSVEIIGDETFLGCQSLSDVTISEGVKIIGNRAFGSCDSIRTVTIPSSVESVGYNAFIDCGSLSKVVLNSDAVVSRGYNSDRNSYDSGFFTKFGTDVAEYVIGDGVTSIGANDFFGCTGMTSVTIPESVTRIESGAFEGCTSLPSIILPESLTGIGNVAFKGCTSLSGITIPGSVESVGDEAFLGCSSLISVTSLNTTPPSITSSTFSSYDATLYVPAGCVTKYEQANYWKNFYDIRGIGSDSVETAIVGEVTIKVSAPVNDNYETKNFSVDMEAVCAALGCTIDDIADVYTMNNGRISGEHNEISGGYYYNEEGVLTPWGSDAAFFIGLASETGVADGEYTVGQMAGHFTNITEPVICHAQLVFKYSEKYYIVNVEYTVTLPVEVNPSLWTMEYAETYDVQLVSAEGYVQDDTSRTIIDLNAIAAAIGTDTPTLYGESWDGGTMKYSDEYSCDPNPGFWMAADGISVGYWGSGSAYGMTYANGVITYYAMDDNSVTTGASFESRFYLVNVENGKYAKITLNVKYVDERVDASGINGIAADKSMSGKIYDLKGREVYVPTKGIYIIDGKKVVIK